MKSANISQMSPSPTKQKESAAKTVHPAWRALIEYCAELDHGEIEVLKIQNGLPVLAEVTRKKVKFTP
jgi:bisphosphoglycerate-dependent phosphoglycerate mutase